MIKKIIIAFLLIILSYIIVICSYNQKTVLTVGLFVDNWEVPNGNDYKVIDRAISEFEKIHPDVEISYNSGILKNDYSSWLAQKIIEGHEPDVFMVLDEDFNTLSSLGVLLNLTDLINEDNYFDINDYYESALKSGQYNNRQYALPYECNPTLMFVNKTLLAKEGIPIPSENWTLDDLYNISKKITKDTNNDGQIDQFGCYNFTWLNATQVQGLNLFDKDGKKCDIDRDEVKNSINFIEKLYALNNKQTVTLDDFNTGKVAFSPMSFAQYRAYKPYPWKVKKFSNFEWDCIVMPSMHDKKFGEMDSLLFGISSRTHNQELAWEFLKMLTYEKDIQKDLYKYSQGVSALKSVNKPDCLVSLIDKGDSVNQINIQLIDNVMQRSEKIERFKNYDAAIKVMDLEIKDIIDTNKDLDIGLLDVEKNVDKFLNE